MTEEKKTLSAELAPPVKQPPPAAIDPQLVLSRLRDPQTLSKISYILAQHGITTSKPLLRLDMEASGDSQLLDLETDDLHKLFSTFGPVESIVIQPSQKTSAVILFKDLVSAYLALQALNNYYVPTYNARLNLKWMMADDAPTATDPATSIPRIETEVNCGL